MPVTMPDVPIVAKVPSLLLHVPPVVASLSDVVNPTQTLAVPLMIPGIELTVATAVALQPEGKR